MSSSNTEYFTRRAREERSAAEIAQDPVIASVHGEMAELYETAARVAKGAPHTPIPVIGDPAGA